jgi:protein-S-isoprenylcysteine O-methyltransferase Ste14
MKEGYKRNSYDHREDLAGEYKWGDNLQLVLLFVFIIGIIFDLLILKISESWQNVFPWYFRIVIFVPMIIIAWYFVNRSHKKIFEDERKELILINTGIYSIIRHPMYFGSIMIYLSFVILTLSVISLMIFILGLILYYYLSRYEEKLLIEKVGKSYLEYMIKTPMLIPFLKIRKS